MDSTVIEPDLSQPIHVSSLHRCRMLGQLESVAKEFSVGLANCHLQGVRPGQLIDELTIGTQRTESRSVVAQSVVASIVSGYHYGQHFPLQSAQGGRPVHDGSIKSQVRFENRWIDPVNAQDIVGVEFTILGWNILNKCHGYYSSPDQNRRSS